MKILVVDDELSMLELLTSVLSKNGYQVASADSGERALECVDEDAPDLIISDVRMPGIDGWEFFRKVRLHPRAQSVPFIFVTGLNTAPDRVRGLQMGADDFISKPFSLEELLARVERSLTRQRKRVEEVPRSSEGIQGKLGYFSLIDMIQILELNRRSAVITLKHKEDEGKLYVHDGVIEGVSVNGTFDFRRFYKLLLWENAEFIVGEYAAEVPPNARVALPARELILESARMYDEENK